MTRVYISGPISNDPFYEEKFAAAEKKIKAMGFACCNPATEGKNFRKTLGHEPSHAEYMKYLLPLLCDCTFITMLPGWENSDGARTEHDVSIACGISEIEIYLKN